jgi:ABC-type lipopolysaccharide export system ATPase subunit
MRTCRRDPILDRRDLLRGAVAMTALAAWPRGAVAQKKPVQVVNREGTTILLVEQNARKTLAIAHRGFLLQKGEIVGQGTAAALAELDLVRHAYLRA